ncbi:hypothetical protein M1567_00135 [Candidatus Marsarchaeota archaeon]|nr:hypothetical protein [Candidatus Marsarchaeota archaeon]
MATGKLMVASRDMQVLALLLLILVVLPSSAHASSSSVASTFCIGTQNAPGIIPPSTEITTGNALSSGVFTISISILALIFAIVGMAWAIGYALGINLLVNFSKTEIGEIAISLIILLVLLGTMATITGGTSPGRIFSNYNFYGIFSNDCYIMTLTALNTTSDFRSLTIIQDYYSLISHTTVTVAPNYFGFSFMPYIGLTVVNQIIKMMMEFTGIIIALFFGLSVFLAIIYGLFPIFLYIGIVLRTIPWTRAAGGAFIGLFIGFYILLPLLLGFVTTVSFSNVPVATFDTSIFSLSSFSGNPISSLSYLVSFISGNILINFIEGVVAPSIYVIIGVVISIMLSLDFAETMGDYLGAPSLSSGHALKGLV